jgi:DNA-binding NarL/FixJ family response regulator
MDEIVSVLIADSRAHARSAMRLLLAQEPDVVVVGEAVDVKAAVAAIAVCRPDMVLLDWDLSKQNGNSAVDDLRAASPESLVIALSSLPEARQEALAAGVDSFVSKGDPPEKLLAAVGSCRRRRKDI